MDVRMHVNALYEARCLRCPRCKCVWEEFSGCSAVACGNPACAPANFCGWCCEDHSPDAHQHATHCQYNPHKGNVHALKAELQRAHAERRRRVTAQYLGGIGDAELRARVGQAVERVLIEDGTSLAEVLGGGGRVGGAAAGGGAGTS